MIILYPPLAAFHPEGDGMSIAEWQLKRLYDPDGVESFSWLNVSINMWTFQVQKHWFIFHPEGDGMFTKLFSLIAGAFCW